MDDLVLIKKLRNIWDKDFTDVQKGTSYGESGIGTFEDLVFESNKDDPDVEDMLEYCFAVFYYEILDFCGCGDPTTGFMLDCIGTWIRSSTEPKEECRMTRIKLYTIKKKLEELLKDVKEELP